MQDKTWIAFASGALMLAVFTPAVAADAPFSVPVETFATGKAKGKPGIMWDALSAGDYNFYAKLTSMGRAGGAMLSKVKYKVTVEYRFTRSDQTALLTGKCQIGAETQTSLFGLVNETASGALYACATENTTPADYALEVAVPPVGETDFKASDMMSVSIDKDRSDGKYAKIKARMTYKGVVYEAVPTSYDASRSISRIVDGYLITRDGKPVGRVDVKGTARAEGTMTVPVAEADGREAVIYFASHLIAMPELNAGFMRALIGAN